MIRFKRNETTKQATVVEGVAEFRAMLTESVEVASKLATNYSQAIELYLRFNDDSNDFAIKITEEKFDNLKFGYGLDQNGQNIKITPVLLANKTVMFMAFMPDVNTPGWGYIIPVTLQDGDVLSTTPVKAECEENKESDDKDLCSKKYRSQLFTLANKLYKDLNVSKKEAFRMAKEQLNKCSAPQPEPKVINKKPEVKAPIDELLPLTEYFKKLTGLITEIDDLEASIKGELDRLSRKDEKKINPTPPSMNILDVLAGMLDDAINSLK